MNQERVCWIPTQYTFTGVGGPHSISVSFVQAVVTPTTYVVAASAGPNGRISPAGDVSVTSGKNQTFNILPNSGYTISELLVDGSPVEECDDEIDMCWVPDSYTFFNVREGGHTISAEFARP